MGPSRGLVTQKADMEELEGNDEITEMLLRTEWSNKAGIVTPSDSDNKSDDGDAIAEQPGYDDNALLAASFTYAEREEGGAEEMKNGTDENDDITTIKVGGEDYVICTMYYDITDVTPNVEEEEEERGVGQIQQTLSGLLQRHL